MPLGIVGDRILFDESRQCATPTSIQCHCNSRGGGIGPPGLRLPTPAATPDWPTPRTLNERARFSCTQMPPKTKDLEQAAKCDQVTHLELVGTAPKAAQGFTAGSNCMQP